MSRGPEREVTVIDVLRIFVGSPDPAFLKSELAEELGVSGETIRNRLSELEERGFVEKKKPNTQMAIYWITPEGYEFYTEETQDS